MKMNLKDWKKVSTHATHTVLKNKHGHELKIVHKALSQGMQSELDKLEHYDDGGVVSQDQSKRPQPSTDSPDIDPKKAKDFSKGATETKPKDFSYIRNLKEGLGMADGGVVAGEDSTPSKDSLGTSIGYPGSPKPKPKMFADGGDVEAPAAPQPTVVINTGGQGAPNVMPDAKAPTPQPQAAAQPQPAQQPDINAVDQQAQQLGATAQPSPQDPQGAAPITQEQAAQVKPSPYDAAALGEQKAQGALGAGQAEAQGMADQAGTLQKGLNQLDPHKMQALYTTLQQSEIQSQQEYQKRYDDYKATLDKKDANGNPVLNIDPNRYLNTLKADTGKSLLTGIGLFLGGIGQAFGGGPNPAMAMMNNAIDRDVQAQKNAVGQKETLYSMAFDKYKNDRMATQEARHQLMYNTMQQMQEQALKSGSQAQMDRAKMAQADAYNAELPQIQTQNMNRIIQTIQQEGGNKGEALRYLRAIAPEQAKQIEEHSIPSLGPNGSDVSTQRSVPNEVVNDLSAKKNSMEMTNKLIDFIGKNTIEGRFNPEKRAEGEALAAEVSNAYRKSQQLSSSEGEKKAIDELIPQNPSDITAYLRQLPKIKVLRNTIDNQMKNSVESYGGNYSSQLPTDPRTQGFMDWANKNPHTELGKAYIKKYGTK